MDATAAMAVAAREAGVSRLVNLVMLQSSGPLPTPRMRQNYLSEQVFEWADIGAVHLRATVFYENLGAMARQSLPAQGAVRLPWGGENTVLPMISAEDVARVATGLLTSEKLVPGTAYPLIGATISLKNARPSAACSARTSATRNFRRRMEGQRSLARLRAPSPIFPGRRCARRSQ
jgi:uncharacterized protein YbjT (DUF2867 family)